jgi:hypothetical protein
LMPQGMNDAAALFDAMQARGRADASKRPGNEDPRPKLGQALMKSIEDAIPLGIAKGFPSLLARELCGSRVAAELGIVGRASFASRLLYVVLMAIVRVVDKVMRIFMPQFSISRMLGRVLGYRMMSKLLMDQTRPLKLPNHLLNQLHDMVDQWSDDNRAPSWINWIEDRLTVRGQWASPLRRGSPK